MAHSHQGHREHTKSRSRVDRIAYSGEGSNVEHEAKGYKRGGKVTYAGKGSGVEHDAEEGDNPVPGHRKGGQIRATKYARGGKTKHGSQVNIAIVTPHHKDAPAGAAPPPAAPPRPPMPPMPPAGGPPPGMMPPPGAMPPGGAGLPPQLAGAVRPPMKRGGAVGVTLAGSESGPGRLLHAHKAARD